MNIDDKTVDKIASLAKLEFSGDEKTAIINDMNKMLVFIDKLNELDTDNVAPLIHMTDDVNVLREDEVRMEITQEEALKNAPSKDSTYFKIPKVLNQ